MLPYVLLDGDAAGSQAAKNLKDPLYQGSQKIVFTTDQLITSMTEMEIEDLMPAELLIQVLDKMERRPKEEFEDISKAGLPIVPQIKAWAPQTG